MLTACGGGGGGGASAPAPVVDNLQRQVATSTYTAGEKLSAYNYLNAQRSACGFGLLQQAGALDQAAQAHASYMTTNSLAVTHFEDQVTFPSGFTGVDVAARATAAGYTWTHVGEVVGGSNVTYGSSFGQASIMDLFTGPYHGNAMIRGYSDVGFGFSTVGADPNWNRFVANFGATAQRPIQNFGGDQVSTYPCQGTTGVLSKTYVDESPAPIPGRNLATNPIGHPIYVKVREGQTLVLSTWDVRKVGATSPVTVQLLNKANDPNNNIIDDSVAILLPTAPLEKNVSYQVTATGTNDGRAVSVNFTFGTGAN
jgi:uncharacterized protein YkwD